MIKALIVGLGWWGQTLVNSVHKKSEKINICYGLTRTSSVAANDYTKSRNIELLDGIYEDVVQQGDIDAVILATPHSQHSQQSRALLLRISSKRKCSQHSRFSQC